MTAGYEGRLFIGGEFREAQSGNRFEVINPADESVVGMAADAAAEIAPVPGEDQCGRRRWSLERHVGRSRGSNQPAEGETGDDQAFHGIPLGRPGVNRPKAG